MGATRAYQLLAGADVADAADVAEVALRVPVMAICPWAVREGVILKRLDCLDGT